MASEKALSPDVDALGVVEAIDPEEQQVEPAHLLPDLPGPRLDLRRARHGVE